LSSNFFKIILSLVEYFRRYFGDDPYFIKRRIESPQKNRQRNDDRLNQICLFIIMLIHSVLESHPRQNRPRALGYSFKLSGFRSEQFMDA